MALEKGDKIAVPAHILMNGTAGRKIPDEVLAGTPADMKAWLNQQFLNYQGDVAIVTVNRLFNRTETKTSVTVEK